MPVKTFTKTGAKASTAAKLDNAIFGVEVKNHQLLKEAYLAYLSNGRKVLAQTKKRGEVSGGGAKPYRQKGTGRARAGSIRSPIWRGGGITFGPTGEENFSRKLSTTAKRQAVCQALSLANSADSLTIIDELDVADGKTASAVKLLSKFGLSGNILLVAGSVKLPTQRALRNLEGVSVVSPKYLNVYDLLNADKVVITKPSLAEISSWLGRSSKSE